MDERLELLLKYPLIKKNYNENKINYEGKIFVVVSILSIFLN